MCRFSLFASLKQYSHDHLHVIGALDEPFTRVLQMWGMFWSALERTQTPAERNDLLNETLFLLVGDHGHRLQQSKNTYYGQLEERQAFYALRVPKWFKDVFNALIRTSTKAHFALKIQRINVRSDNCLQSTQIYTEISTRTHCDQ